MDKRRASTFASAKLLNPLVRAAVRTGLPLPGYVLLETTGRRSGKPRQVPVGKALEGETLWVVPSTACAPPTSATSRPTRACGCGSGVAGGAVPPGSYPTTTGANVSAGSRTGST